MRQFQKSNTCRELGGRGIRLGVWSSFKLSLLLQGRERETQPHPLLLKKNLTNNDLRAGQMLDFHQRLKHCPCSPLLFVVLWTLLCHIRTLELTVFQTPKTSAALTDRTRTVGFWQGMFLQLLAGGPKWLKISKDLRLKSRTDWQWLGTSIERLEVMISDSPILVELHWHQGSSRMLGVRLTELLLQGPSTYLSTSLCWHVEAEGFMFQQPQRHGDCLTVAVWDVQLQLLITS